MKEKATATTIEYFLSIEETKDNSKLLYFNAEGQSVEKDVSRAVLDNALKFFSTPARSVRRSSGGLILAEPVQIVLYEQTGQRTEVRVKVRFRDFTRSHGAHYCVSHTKVVAQEELLEPFSLEFEGPRAQSFALDFGKGIVPVHIFGYEEHDGTIYAYFLEARDWEKLKAAGGNQVRVQPYRVEQSALRWIGSANGQPTAEHEQARLNYQRLLKTGAPIVPRELRAGGTIDVPPRPAEELSEFLRVRLQRRYSRGATIISIDAKRDEAETVFPIGFSEAA